MGAVTVDATVDVAGELTTDAVALAQVPLERLEAEITSFAGALAAATARWLVWVGEYDRRQGWEQWQAKSCAHWLSWRCGVSLRTGREHVRVAKRLGECATVRERFLAGQLSYSKVRAITRVADATNEADLVRLASVATASQVDRLCAGIKRAGGDEAAGARAAVDNQFVVYANNHDGTATISITVPVADAKAAHAGIYEAADVEIERCRQPGHSNKATITERGGLGRIRAEAAVGLLAGIVDAVDAVGGEALLVVDNDVLRGDELGGTCTVDGERVAPVVAQRLCCDARLQIALEGPDGEPLGIGRKSKVVPMWLRRQVLQRDHGMCRFPGCDATRRLHVHHIEHWAHGGATDLANLVAVCTLHHHSVHEGGWQVVPNADGLAFRDPNGFVFSPGSGAAGPLPTARIVPVGVEPLAGSGVGFDVPDTVSTYLANSANRRDRMAAVSG